jgi:hypothetical protein
MLKCLSAYRPSRTTPPTSRRTTRFLSRQLAAIFNKRLGALLFVCHCGGCYPPADTQTGWFVRLRALRRIGETGSFRRVRNAAKQDVHALSSFQRTKAPQIQRLNHSGFPQPPDVSGFRLRFGGALQGNLSTLRRRSRHVNPVFVSAVDFFRRRRKAEDA